MSLASIRQGNRMIARLAPLAVLSLLPLTVFGQADPPPEVDQALRARITQFFTYMVEGNFRKANDLVAEDTKDEYFNGSHSRLNSFKIESLTYSENFTKAELKLMAKRNMNIGGLDVEIPVPSLTTWKIEDGKWVWYHNADPGRIGIIAPDLVSAPQSNNPAVAGQAAPDDAAMRAALQMALKQPNAVLSNDSGVDKSEVILSADQVSEAKVVFHNGVSGGVQLQITTPANVPPGFSAKLEKGQAIGGEDVGIRLRYDPGDKKQTPGSFEVRVMTVPFNQVFAINVKFGAAR